MVAAPILTNVLDHAKLTTLAKGLAWIGYNWLGVSLIAFFLCLTCYFIYLVMYVLDQLIPSGFFKLSPFHISWTVLLLTLVLTLCSALGHRDLTIKTLNLSSSKIQPLSNPLKIVFITDLHLGLMAGKKTAKQIVSRIERIDPDLLLCTGDLLDGNLAELGEIASTFQKINPEMGKYTIIGNHETYIGTKKATSILEQAGFIVLNNKSAALKENIGLLGLNFENNKNCELEQSLVQDLDPKRYNILLKHAPDLCKQSTKHINLQLSGHTHNGQIFPFNLITKLIYPYISGRYDLVNKSILYVNPGTGSWGPRMRLGSKREISVINLKSQRLKR